MPGFLEGAKFYLAALAVMMLYALVDLQNSPIPADLQDEVGWGLGIAISGIGFLIGPELLDIARVYVGKLAGKAKDPE